MFNTTKAGILFRKQLFHIVVPGKQIQMDHTLLLTVSSCN